MAGIARCTSAPTNYEYLLYLPEGYAEQQEPYDNPELYEWFLSHRRKQVEGQE